METLALGKNLERDGDDSAIAGWQVRGYVDLVSERRYALWRLKASPPERHAASTVAFRLAAARALAGEGCPETVACAQDGGTLAVLTERVAPIPPNAVRGARALTLLASVARTLETLEAHGFCATNLTPETVVVADDERVVLSPAAVALAPARLESSPAGAARQHAAGLGALARSLGAVVGDPHGQRLRALADAVDAGEIVDSTGFLRALDRRHSARTRAARGDAKSVEVPRNAALVGILGGARSGKTATIETFAREESALAEVCRVDEWELLGRARRKGGGRERAANEWWVIDDIEEVRYGLARLEDHLAAGGRVVYTADPAALPTETGAFLDALRQRAEAAVEMVTLDTTARPQRGTPGRSLGALDADDQRLVELCAVAGHALPLALLAAVFGETNGDLPRRLHALSRAGLVAIDYRSLPPAQEITVAVSVPSASLRRSLYDTVPEPRRSNLHRTLARLGTAVGAFPVPLVYHHLVRGGDARAAARQALALLRDTTREARAPYVDVLVRELLEEGRYETLAYAERLLLLTRLGADLFSRGRRADAERLLVEARDLEAEPEELGRHAPLLSETMRLLADVWAARSNFTQALELLEEARELLKAHLSLPEQARLMNEIGWLQYRLGDYDSAIDSCKLSLTTLNPNEHPLVVAQALNLTGVIHYNTSRYDEAISYYERSAFLREREGDRNALAGSYNNLALAYQSKGEYDKALAAYNRSLEIKKEQNNEAGIANGYLNLALLHLEIHNYDEAEKRCRDSLRISTHLGMAQLIAENHSTLGDIAFRRGSYQEAEDAYRKSLALAQSLETTNEEMGARRRLAKLYSTTGRPAQARQSIEEAARLARQIGSKYETAEIEGIRGELAAGESRFAEAIEHFEKSASAYASVSRYRDAAAALARIGQAHVKNGNPFEARHYLDRALDVVKSDIGFEIPDEIVTLQQLLREQPGRQGEGIGGTAAQKLLYAFYELSALTDYADDVRAFCERILRVFQDLTGASTCMLALQAEEGAFVNVRAGREREPLVDPALRTLFTRALQLGTLLTSDSEEAGDVAEAVQAHAGPRFACVPMKAMGRSLGCVLLAMPASSFPLSKYDANFIAAIGRHVAGDLRLMFHLREHAHKEETLEKEFESLRAQVVDRYRFQNLIGKDESMKKVFRTIEKVKDMDTGLLIIGESGTGKTELARIIHFNSPRRRRHFQQIHCAEIPTNLLESELFGHEKGAFTGAVQRKLGRCEVADGGTVFLDDVNVMPLDTQAKLLHYLESKSFTRLGGTQKITTDVRIIAASNEDLEKLVKVGRFREDLYYRLKVLQIELPPLRERKEDLIAISQDFLKKRCLAQGKPLKTLSAETIRLMQAHAWPGNVRELQNVLEQVVLLSDDDIVEPSSLPEDFLKRATGRPRAPMQSLEALAQQLVEAGHYSESSPLMPQLELLLASKMAAHADNKTRAAALLGITKPTLYNRLRGYEKLR